MLISYSVCLIFLLGLVVVAMSIARMFYIHDFTTTFNTTYYYSFAGLYSNIEAYLSQLVCVLPGIQQLWKAATNNFSPLASKKSSRESIRISAPLHIPERHDFASIHTPERFLIWRKRNIQNLLKRTTSLTMKVHLHQLCSAHRTTLLLSNIARVSNP